MGGSDGGADGGDAVIATAKPKADPKAKARRYTEIVITKTDANVEGAIYRENEFKIMLMAMAEMCGGMYQEDEASCAALIPSERVHMGSEDISAAKSEVLGYVDVCGAFTPEQIRERVDKLKARSEETGIPIGVELIKRRIEDMTVHKIFSMREWEI